MAHWLISCHASIDSKLCKTAFGTGKNRIDVPEGMSLIVFTAENRQLGMIDGWLLWEMLMHGRHGGAFGAVGGMHKQKTGAKAFDDLYLYSNNEQWWYWPPAGTAAGTWVNTIGVWEVGNPRAPVIDIPTAGMQLSEVIARAQAAGVTRIYHGACRAVTKGGALTQGSEKIALVRAWDGLRSAQGTRLADVSSGGVVA